MVFERAYILPILVLIWFPLTFIITYSVAVLRKDVHPIFPYISDTGTWSPESCIFGQMLNIGAILMLAITYIRYLQVNYIIKENTLDTKIKCWNTRGFVIAIIAVTGVSVVANFQATNILIVHLMGAFAAFSLGTVYQYIQVWLSYKLLPKFGTKRIARSRLACAIICTVTNIGAGSCGAIAIWLFKGDDFTKWTKDDGGYDLHLVSATNEWILVMSTVVFFFLFTFEFKGFKIQMPLPVTSTNKEDPVSK